MRKTKAKSKGKKPHNRKNYLRAKNTQGHTCYMFHFLRFSGKVKNTHIVETPTGPSLK